MGLATQRSQKLHKLYLLLIQRRSDFKQTISLCSVHMIPTTAHRIGVLEMKTLPPQGTAATEAHVV